MNFSEFVSSVLEVPVAHAWRGHGATVFLELGGLTEGGIRQDGTTGNPRGDFTLTIDSNWRVEGKRSILCGSDEPHPAIERCLASLVGRHFTEIALYSSLLELQATFSRGPCLRTFSAWKGQPSWDLIWWEADLVFSSRFGKLVQSQCGGNAS
jgi:hypothetical protein